MVTCDSLQRGKCVVGFQGLSKCSPSFRPQIVVSQTGEGEQENGCHMYSLQLGQRAVGFEGLG